MYLIRLIDGTHYLQLTEKLPLKIKNAITHRYERSRIAVRIVLTVLLIVVTVSDFGIAIQDGDASVADSPLYYGGLVAMVVLAFVLFFHLGIVRRHKSVMSDLQTGLGYGFSPRKYLMPESDRIYIALMAPALVDYLMDPKHQLWSGTKVLFEEYLGQAAFLLTRTQRSTVALSDKSEKLKIEYSFKQALNKLAEEYVKLIVATFFNEKVDLGNYFVEQRQKAEQKYQANCAALVVKNEKKIEELRSEIQQAQAQSEEEIARLQGEVQNAQAPTS